MVFLIIIMINCVERWNTIILEEQLTIRNWNILKCCTADLRLCVRFNCGEWLMQNNHMYIAIDLKTFYASVECVERNLDPLDTNLVVADPQRTEKTICLAVSPSLKAFGISGRARLFEVVQKVKEVNALRKSRLRNRFFHTWYAVHQCYQIHWHTCVVHLDVGKRTDFHDWRWHYHTNGLFF